MRGLAMRDDARKMNLVPADRPASPSALPRGQLDDLDLFWAAWRQARRPAFTLIESLIVIAIILILIALLLPAIQQAREAARRTQCRNHVSQLVLALQNYQVTHAVLPSGSVNPTGPIKSEKKGYHVSWLVQIMPQLEQQNCFAMFDFDHGVYDPENVALAAMSFPVLYCPSVGGVVGGGGLSHYAGNHHDCESPIDVDNHGVLFLNSSIRLNDVTDGVSHTVYVGEVSGGVLPWTSGTAATLRNGSLPDWSAEAISYLNLPGSQAPLPPLLDSNKQPIDPLMAVGGFHFNHVEAFHVGMGDGAVRVIGRSTNRGILRRLTHRADGELIEEF
jgi:prepilin-type N-terminal cleavage/methylation domain-containing protein